MLKFAPIMPAFCLLLLYSSYANNFARKIDASLEVLQIMTHASSKMSILKVGFKKVKQFVAMYLSKKLKFKR